MRVQVRCIGFEVMKRSPAGEWRVGGKIVHHVNVQGVSRIDYECRGGKRTLVRWPLDYRGLPGSGIHDRGGGDLGVERGVQHPTGRLPDRRLWKPIAGGGGSGSGGGPSLAAVGGVLSFVGAPTDNFGYAESQKHKSNEY